MQLNDSTIQVLKNFAQINSNIVIDKGNVIKTIAEAKNVFASATIPDEFPARFGIYDLNEFLGVLNLVDSPNFAPAAGYATISDGSGRSKVKYYFTDPEMLTSPSREVKMPPADVSFRLDSETLSRIKSAAGALGHTEVSVTPADGVLTLTVFDSENKTSNTYSIDIPGKYDADTTFTLVFNIGNLKKLIPASYTVEISSKLISHFKSEDSDLPVEYFVALEKTSKYGE